MNEPMEKVLCPSCNSPFNHNILFEKNDCIVYRCNYCGLGLANPSNFNPQSYYTEEYFNGGLVDGYSDYLGSEYVLRAEFARTLRVLKQYCPPGGRLLEIGCAYGFFLKEAESEYEVYGLEIAEDAVNTCHHAGLLNVHQGIVDDNTLSLTGMVDAIVLLDVIEHLLDPFETLRICSKILRPGGVILITTGDFDSFVSRLSGCNWRLMTPPSHLWFFTRSSLANIANILGLDMVNFSRPWKLVPFSLIIFQIGRMAGMNLKPLSMPSLSRLAIPVNLFDAMRIVLRKPLSEE